MDHAVTPYLLQKYADGLCTDEEVAVLHRWYESFDEEPDPFDNMSPDQQKELKMAMFNKFKLSLTGKKKINNTPL